MASTERKDCWANEKLPPPVATNYTAKGEWRMVGELNTYVVGPTQSDKALILAYDVMGVCSQVLQGADRLAEYLDITILMPDYFKGRGPSYEDFKRDPVAARAEMNGWLAGDGSFTKAAKDTLTFVQAAKTIFDRVKSWGIFGFCWGGKVSVLAGLADDTPFKVTGQAHPGRLAVEDAQKMTLPHLCLASKDEPADVVAGYKQILTEKKLGEVQVFEHSIHGWMAVRADLEDDAQREQYERGYAEVARWMAQHL